MSQRLQRSFVLVFLAVSMIRAGELGAHQSPFGDLPPDASSEQLIQALRRQEGAGLFERGDRWRNTPIEEAIRVGVRNMKWVEFINESRDEEDRISLSSPENTKSYPIESPSEYSPRTIRADLNRLRSELPEPLLNVLFNEQPFTNEPPIPEDEFIEWGLRTDRIFQTALRWRGLEPWLDHYEGYRRRDIRGHYFFSRMNPKERDVLLENSSKWSDPQKTEVAGWLVSLCMNSGGYLSSCRGEVNRTLNAGGDARPLYEKWRRGGVAMWNYFFRITNARTDVEFRDENRVRMPFRDPGHALVRAFLKDNIEDEWRFGDWALRLVFSSYARAHVEFRRNVVPHVDRLGGDKIVMNADQPLSEYDAQWTIRHEFGHVLGLPDCYVEYYDRERAVMVNYQIDVKNLMCSRTGRIQKIHVDELRRTYYRPN